MLRGIKLQRNLTLWYEVFPPQCQRILSSLGLLFDIVLYYVTELCLCKFISHVERSDVKPRRYNNKLAGQSRTAPQVAMTEVWSSGEIVIRRGKWKAQRYKTAPVPFRQLRMPQELNRD